MRSRTLYSVCGLAVLIWGCPKRQTTPRVVFVSPAPAATEQKPAASTGALVIQEPPPPEPPPPVIVEEPAAPEEKLPQRRRRPTSPGRAETEAAPEDAPATASPEVPALEQRESAAQQTAQRQQIVEMLAGIRGRVAQMKRNRLGELERKTLDDAQMFVEQSQRALDTNDLVRALNLARKASLLINALQ
ncbi:MAG TPA: hypothetical protein VFM21_04385 [Terriglobia bacterium]|nr:hypothetical protein [Terriglobia bacterium]